MTEIPDLSAIFGQPQEEPPPHVKAHLRRMANMQRDAELLAYAQVQFFGPILCNCERSFTWGEPAPPQYGCVVHGNVQVDGKTGGILMFRPPRKW